MKLHFLGQTYSLPQQQMPTIPSDNTACFRGQQYNLRVPVANSNSSASKSQMSAVVHKYRGVSYIIERHYFSEQPNKPELCCR